MTLTNRDTHFFGSSSSSKAFTVLQSVVGLIIGLFLEVQMFLNAAPLDSNIGLGVRGFQTHWVVATLEEFCFCSQKLETSNVLFEEPGVVQYDRSSLRWVYVCKISQAAFTRLCPDMKQCAGLNILYEMQYLLLFNVFPNFLRIPSKHKVFSLISDCIFTWPCLGLRKWGFWISLYWTIVWQVLDFMMVCIGRQKSPLKSLGLVSVLIHFGLGHDLVLLNVVLTTTLMPTKLSKLIWLRVLFLFDYMSKIAHLKFPSL